MVFPPRVAEVNWVPQHIAAECLGIAVLIGWRATERDDVTVRVFNIEILRAPRRRLQRLENLRSVGNTLFVEGFDAFDARRGIEVVLFPTMLALGGILGRLFQMQLQSIPTTDSVEPAPRLAETKTQPLVVRHRALKVVDEELWSERSETRLGLVRHRYVLPTLPLTWTTCATHAGRREQEERRAARSGKEKFMPHEQSTSSVRFESGLQLRRNVQRPCVTRYLT